MAQSKGKVLVIRGGAIGDFILTLPVLAALRASLPDVHLEVLGYPRIAQLALLAGQADVVRSIEARPLAAFFARDGSLPDELCEYFGSFALIVSYLYDPDEIFRENVARCTRAQFIQGPHRPDETAGVHASDVFLKPLERLAIFDADATPRIAIQVSEPRGGPMLALHPGSGSEKKNWPEARWFELVERLGTEVAERLLIVGGEAEGERCARLAARAGCEVELATHLPLSELAGKLARASCFLGHDSGITHLAAAVGLGGLILWGPSEERVWRPRSERMQLLRSPQGLHALGVELVLETLRPMLRAGR